MYAAGKRNRYFVVHCSCSGKRKFAKKTVFDAHFEGKKHFKAVESSKQRRCEYLRIEFFPLPTLIVSSDPNKSIAFLEYKVFRYSVLLQKVIEKTIRNIEAKQAKNWEELQVDCFDYSPLSILTLRGG
jgi:hypothetical protein